MKWIATCNFDAGKGEVKKGAEVEHSEDLERQGLIAPAAEAVSEDHKAEVPPAEPEKPKGKKGKA